MQGPDCCLQVRKPYNLAVPAVQEASETKRSTHFLREAQPRRPWDPEELVAVVCVLRVSGLCLDAGRGCTVHYDHEAQTLPLAQSFDTMLWRYWL